MESLMTPTTALIFFALDNEAFETPRPLDAQDDTLPQAFMGCSSGSKRGTDLAYMPQCVGPTLPTQEQTPLSSGGQSGTTRYLREEYSYPNSCSPQSDYFSQPSRPSSLGDIHQAADHNDRAFERAHLQQSAGEDYALFGQEIDNRFKCVRKSAQQAQSQIADGTHHSPTLFPAPFAPALEILPPITESSPPPAPEEAKKPRRRNRKRKILSDAEVETKREAFLERNRQAAGKCRSKKKSWVEQLNEDVKSKDKRNGELRAELEDVLQEVQMLRGMVAQCAAENDGLVEKAPEEEEAVPVDAWMIEASG